MDLGNVIISPLNVDELPLKLQGGSIVYAQEIPNKNGDGKYE